MNSFVYFMGWCILMQMFLRWPHEDIKKSIDVSALVRDKSASVVDAAGVGNRVWWGFSRRVSGLFIEYKTDCSALQFTANMSWSLHDAAFSIDIKRTSEPGLSSYELAFFLLGRRADDVSFVGWNDGHVLEDPFRSAFPLQPPNDVRIFKDATLSIDQDTECTLSVESIEPLTWQSTPWSREDVARVAVSSALASAVIGGAFWLVR